MTLDDRDGGAVQVACTPVVAEPGPRIEHLGERRVGHRGRVGEAGEERSVAVEDAGHLVIEDARDEITALVRTFVGAGARGATGVHAP